MLYVFNVISRVIYFNIFLIIVSIITVWTYYILQRKANTKYIELSAHSFEFMWNQYHKINIINQQKLSKKFERQNYFLYNMQITTILNITINSFPCRILLTIESKMFMMRLHDTLNYHGHGNIPILIVIPIPRSYVHADYKWQILLSRIAREFKINICKQNLTALVKLKINKSNKSFK